MILTALSEAYLKSTEPGYRKERGQYFTPKPIQQALLARLPEMREARILEPSCGTGEFVGSISEKYKDAKIDAIELDKKLFNLVKRDFEHKESISFLNRDALTLTCEGVYDFVIGNPPYFEMKPTKEIAEKYTNVIKGRTNIYTLFVKMGLDALKEGGHLAYVIPTALATGAYFERIREYIVENSEIVDMITFDKAAFKGANQQTMVLILKKGENTGKNIFKRGGRMIFSTSAETLTRAFRGKYSLSELGFKVETGKVVWNQNKDILSVDDKDTLLVWAHNVGVGKLKSSDRRAQYIKLEGNTSPALFVNRIIGAGASANLRAAASSGRKPWQAENHVNVVSKKGAKLKDLQDLGSELMSSDVLRIVRLVTANTQISKSELEHLVPISG